jgi:hypothetical protein
MPNMLFHRKPDEEYGNQYAYCGIDKVQVALIVAHHGSGEQLPDHTDAILDDYSAYSSKKANKEGQYHHKVLVADVLHPP